MTRPILQDALTQESSLFERAGRRFIFEVANRPDSENGWIAESPANHGRDRFGHEAAAPMSASEKVSEIDSILVLPRRDAAGQLPGFAGKNKPAELGSRFPPAQESLDRRIGILEILVRLPHQIPGHLRILPVGTEDQGSIFRTGLAQK